MKKTEKNKLNNNKTDELLLSIRNLLILQLSNSKVPVLDIVKAAKMRSNDIYNIIPKKKKQKTPPSNVEL